MHFSEHFFVIFIYAFSGLSFAINENNLFKTIRQQDLYFTCKRLQFKYKSKYKPITKISRAKDMLKTFMIEKIEEEVCSDSTGKMIFHLVDENGDCRTVCGMTFLDKNGEAQGISSVSKRELPLIENLFSERHKKIVDIEFEHFNKVYDREQDKTINQIAYEKVLQMEKEKKLSYRLANLFKKTPAQSESSTQNAPK